MLLLAVVAGDRRPDRWQGLLQVWDMCRWGNRGFGDGLWAATIINNNLQKIRHANLPYEGPSGVLLLVVVAEDHLPTRWRGLLLIWDACRWGNRGFGDGL